jgi:hypothetical protein
MARVGALRLPRLLYRGGGPLRRVDQASAWRLSFGIAPASYSSNPSLPLFPQLPADLTVFR